MILHLNDLDADFRAIFHMTPADVAELTGPQFMALAYRTTAYPGVMAARIAEQSRKTESGEIESSPEQLQTNSALADVIDYG